MLDRQYGKVVFECDSCGEALDTDEADFDVARRIFADNGWKATKLFDAFYHYCGRCKGENTQREYTPEDDFR